MLNLFRQNTAFAASMLVVFALLLRVPIFVWPHAYNYIETAPLSKTIFTFLKAAPNHLLLSNILALILLVFQALFINYIVVQHSILYKDTFLPGLFFVAINCIYPEQSELTPQLISNTFILLMFQRLCFLYESSNPLLLVLDAGMYLGLALLFNYDVAVFLPYILISVIIFTSFNFRYLAVSVIGIFTPLYFAAVIYYLSNDLEEIIAFIGQSFERKLLGAVSSGYHLYLPAIIIVPILLISTLKLQFNFFSNKVKTRRILQSMLLLFFFGVLGLIIENVNFIYALFYLSIPISIVIAYYFISDKKLLMKELLFFAIIGFGVYYNIIRPLFLVY